MSKALISTVSLLVLLAMGYYAVRESKLTDPTTHKSRVPALVLAIIVSAILIFGWRL